MTVVEALDIGRETILTMLKIGSPLMLIALAVGLSISLVQALTQIQEITLTFVPKILVIFVAMIFLMPFMLATLISFTQGLADRIVGLGA
ncbi:MAG: flagellar biosynthesis protein FliQ [Inquilinus sp.]|nr:flagellar biosynthesis protein FliQ [Inquilinus sp.]